MTKDDEPMPGAGHPARHAGRGIALSLLRAAGSIVVIVTVYYLLPLDTSSRWAAITILVVGLIALLLLIGLSIRSIPRSRFPGLRAVEALAVTVPLFLVLFAGGYAVMDRITPASFTQTLTHTDALYFAVTIFSTVGFGDITPRTEAARLVVTVQMILDLVVIGVAIQAIVGAARRGRQRQSEKALGPAERKVWSAAPTTCVSYLPPRSVLVAFLPGS